RMPDERRYRGFQRALAREMDGEGRSRSSDILFGGYDLSRSAGAGRAHGRGSARRLSQAAFRRYAAPALRAARNLEDGERVLRALVLHYFRARRHEEPDARLRPRGA